MLTTAELLAAVKRAQGITSAAALARTLGVPEKSVYRWQQGKHTPDGACSYVRQCAGSAAGSPA